MGSCKCRRNVYMLAIAFLCNFTSYMTLESMQSSLNRSTGTTALCLLYATLVLSSLLLPPLAIAKLDCRKSLFLSMLMYALYALANFYPTPYVLIPAAILLGTGASVMWACGFYYVMQLAQKHAKEKNKSVETVTSDFFGKFTSLSHISILIGTIFMSVVFESLKVEVDSNNDDEIAGVVNTTATTQVSFLSQSTITFNGTEVNEDDSTCGLYYKLSEPVSKKQKSVSDVVMYVLLSIYLAFNILAALLCLCLDEVTGTETTDEQQNDAICASMSSLNGQTHQVRVNGTTSAADTEKNQNESLVHRSSEATAVQGKVIKDDQSVLKLVRSTIRLLLTDKAAFLLIPFTLHYGMIQGFVRGAFNASWITCALGIKYVAYVTCMYGGVMIIGCFTFGKLLKYTTHMKIFVCTMSFEVILFVITLLWYPPKDASSQTWVFFLLPVGFGICHSSLSSQLGSIYSRFFADNKKAGTALLGVWNPMGSAIAFGLGGALYPVHLIALVLAVCIVGTIMYVIAEMIKDKQYRKCSGGCVSL